MMLPTGPSGPQKYIYYKEIPLLRISFINKISIVEY